MGSAPMQLFTTEKPVLISFDLCPFVQRSAILLALKGQAFERINIDLRNKPQWFLDLVPTGKVPVLVLNQEQKDGLKSDTIFESSIINEYLDEHFTDPLHPKNALEKAKHRSWINFCDSLLMTQYQAITATKLHEASKYIDHLFNELIKLRPDSNGFYSGTTFSLVDVSYAPLFARLKWIPSLKEKLIDHAQSNESTHSLLLWIDNIAHSKEVVNSVPKNFDEQFSEHFLALDSAVITAQLQFS